ncbi:hypothetical protein HanXRQr2_Chr05g0199571 [Helianthus annuus]|uniref:Uncharacterized protein n=1 Tax=Helianthus annuus TaxID=4232 RepID=A0A9K3NL67_HELAN|nr:hypothetical protein HanXRQr2_Chr05g0199571 [Helianthus annuus]
MIINIQTLNNCQRLWNNHIVPCAISAVDRGVTDGGVGYGREQAREGEKKWGVGDE